MQEYRDKATDRIYREFTSPGSQRRRQMRQSLGYASGQTLVRQIQVGRNDPCPCGSNKKFKKCCIDQVDIYQDSFPTETLYPNQTDEFTELMFLAERRGWTVPVNTAHRMESWLCYWRAMIKHGKEGGGRPIAPHRSGGGIGII